MTTQYRVRPCTDASDAAAIHGMVYELAHFEKQPQALTQTVDDYKRDAFETNPPLFHAALAEYNDGHAWAPVGVAVWYFTYSTWTGKAFFLEDCECSSANSASLKISNPPQSNSNLQPIHHAIYSLSLSLSLVLVLQVFVKAAHRRKGLGRRLLTHCIQSAHDSACARIEWMVLNWNSRAIQLYKAIGGVEPDDGVWNLMRMDQQAIKKYLATCDNTS